MNKQNAKRAMGLFFISAALTALIGMSVFAAGEGPLPENAKTGGTDPGGSGGYSEYWRGDAWCGMRVTIIDISDSKTNGKVAAGTASVDITGINEKNDFFTRKTAGDRATQLSNGNKVTHFGGVSKLEYRDGAKLNAVTGGYEFKTVPNFPVLL